MQSCSNCRQILIIGLTASLHENGTNSPDIECLNCQQLNEPRAAAYEPLPQDDEDCVMCGANWKPIMRADGRYYCSYCWTVWNS